MNLHLKQPRQSIYIKSLIPRTCIEFWEKSLINKSMIFHSNNQNWMQDKQHLLVYYSINILLFPIPCKSIKVFCHHTAIKFTIHSLKGEFVSHIFPCPLQLRTYSYRYGAEIRTQLWSKGTLLMKQKSL